MISAKPFLFLLISSLIVAHAISKTDLVRYYNYIINDQLNSSVHYKYRQNASEFEPRPGCSAVEDYGTFDFIIIGGGSAGSVVTNRLSQNPKWKVLLLEAGGFGNDITDIPDMRDSLLLSNYNWGYVSVPQKTACLDMTDQKCIHPRGIGVGGTSLINGLVYARGHKIDFDRWGKENPGWSYQDVLPFFKKTEHLQPKGLVIETQYHGYGGEMNVAARVPQHPLMDIWIKANQEKGYKNLDYNGEHEIGAAAAQFNIKHGKRQDGGTTLIKPILSRPNLNVSTKSYVTKIGINPKTKQVENVFFTKNGYNYMVKVTKEVVLSAGAIASPQILMLSGVGPKEHLRQVGVPLVQDLEVGSTLRDHAMFWGLVFESNYKKNNDSLNTYIKEFLKGEGTLTVPSENDGLGFYHTKLEPDPNYPDLELLISPIDGFYRDVREKFDKASKKFFNHLNMSADFILNVIALHSKSGGTIRLKNSDPFEFPLIDANLLSDSKNVDIDTLYQGVELGLALVKTKAFQEVNTKLVRQVLPACDDKEYLSKDYWYCTLRYFTSTVYHPVATCPMGPDPKRGAVVNANGTVHGLVNLRVADGSVFPFTLSGHTNAPCFMVGERISDFILKKHA